MKFYLKIIDQGSQKTQVGSSKPLCQRCSKDNYKNLFVIVPALWMLQRSGWSYFFTDIGIFSNISFKKKNKYFVFPIDYCL